MKRQNLLLLILTSFFWADLVFAAVTNPVEQQKLVEELTGKKAAVQQNAVKVDPMASANAVSAARPVSRKLLDAGFYACTKKDYISALKYYNTIVVKYPNSNELYLAYLAKSKLYNEMGLVEQAKLNLQMANQIGKKTQTTK